MDVLGTLRTSAYFPMQKTGRSSPARTRPTSTVSPLFSPRSVRPSPRASRDALILVRNFDRAGGQRYDGLDIDPVVRAHARTLTFSAPGSPLHQGNYLPAFINDRLAGIAKGHKSPLHKLIGSIFFMVTCYFPMQKLMNHVILLIARRLLNHCFGFGNKYGNNSKG